MLHTPLLIGSDDDDLARDRVERRARKEALLRAVLRRLEHPANVGLETDRAAEVEPGVDPGAVVVDAVEEPEDQGVDFGGRRAGEGANEVGDRGDLLVEIEPSDRMYQLLPERPLGADADRAPSGSGGVSRPRDRDDVVEESVMIDAGHRGPPSIVRAVTNRPVLVLVLALVLVLVLGCKSKPSGDATAPRAATRIVSLSPSTTEAVFAVGAGAQLVGRSRYCNYPAEALALPQVGGYVDPSFEAILALRPDLVVGARGPSGSAIADRLAGRSVATFFPEVESFEAIESMLRTLGEKTGHPAEGRATAEKVHADVALVEKRIAKLPRRRVLLVFGLEPLSVAGPGSFADEMLRRAGGKNVIEAGGTYPTIGVERVLALDPDVVINAAMMEERSEERLGATSPGWSKVRAVQDGKVRRITDESVLRPGPRIAEGLLTLAKAVYAELGRLPEAE